MLEPGTLLEQRYEVIRVLGSGSFAKVYLARHTGLLSLHAVKVLDDALAAKPDIRQRFLAEGRIQAQLQHPNVVKVTDIVTDPVAGLVLEYVEGPTLAELVNERGGTAAPIPLVLELMLPVLDAVGAAHRQGVVHRDLKPENILVRRDGARLVPMVGDFGIAKVVGGAFVAGKQRTEAGQRIGTPEYMSPEQVRGAQDLDARSDVFSLGAILYEVVTGKMAFSHDSQYDTMKSVVEGSYEPPERVVGTLPPMFAACIRKALAVNREERFPDCESFRKALALASDPEAPLPERPTRSAAVTKASPEKASPEKAVVAALSRPVPPPAAPAQAAVKPAPARPAPPPSAAQEVWAAPVASTPAAPPGSIAGDPGTSPFLASMLSLFCLTGIGQLYNQQVGKGILLMVLHFVFAGITGGASVCVTLPVAMLDAWLVAAKRKRGQAVGAWEWF